MPLFGSNSAVGNVSLQREFAVAATKTFRSLLLLTAVAVSGCATEAGSPHAPLTAAPTAAVAPDAAAEPSTGVDAHRVAADAKRLDLEVVRQNGQVRYCRANVVTGSRFQKDRQCYTAEQVEALHEQAQQSGGH